LRRRMKHVTLISTLSSFLALQTPNPVSPFAYTPDTSLLPLNFIMLMPIILRLVDRRVLLITLRLKIVAINVLPLGRPIALVVEPIRGKDLCNTPLRLLLWVAL